MVVRNCLVAALAIVALSAKHACADDVVGGGRISDHAVYYDVTGNSPEALRRALDESGPMGSDGKRYHGQTKWHIDWTYGYQVAGDRCRMTDFDTDLSVTTTLPHWVERDAAPGWMVRRWDAYVAALELHEAGHRRNAIDAAQALRAAAAKMGDAPDCDALNRAVKRTMTRVLYEYNIRERRYDADTHHGADQGARL